MSELRDVLLERGAVRANCVQALLQLTELPAADLDLYKAVMSSGAIGVIRARYSLARRVGVIPCQECMIRGI
jgi:hypothetical protein